MELPEDKEQEKRFLIEMAAKQEMMLKSMQTEAYKKDFWTFISEVMPYEDLYEPFHKRVCDFIQEWYEQYVLLLLLPRGTFKSSIVTVGFPCWKIAQDPNTRGLIANEIYGKATDFVGQIQRNLKNNEKFKEHFGDLSTDAKTWREDGFIVGTAEGLKSKEMTVKAYGLTGSVTGAHTDWAILDDLVGPTNIRSGEGLDKPKEFFKEVLNVVDPLPSGHRPTIIIGTTWHNNDLYASLMEKDNPASKSVKVLRLPAYTGEWGKGELLFPTRLNWRALANQREIQGPTHFSAQYLLEPVASEKALFKNFKYYEEVDIRGVKMNIFIAVDPAISDDEKRADYSAMICVGVDMNNNWYILDIWRDRVKPSALIDQIFAWDIKWKPNVLAIEATQFQRILSLELYEQMKKRNRYFPVKPLKDRNRSKDDRIKSLEPRYASGTILHNKALSHNADLELELTNFPAGKNDDMIDALATINEIAYPPKVIQSRRTRTKSSFYPA